jgi:hypothetical protein
MKVADLTPTRDTPFWDGISGNSWWYWFKWKHPKVNIRQIERLEVCRTQGLTLASYNSFHTNLQSPYIQHNYTIDHVWNLDETWIQAGKQFGARVLVKRGSKAIYTTIPKSQEWLIIKFAVNVVRGVLLRFYIFKGERLRNDFIKLYKPWTCMVMQKRAWMTSFLFKEFLTFFKKYVPSGVTLVSFGWAW